MHSGVAGHCASRCTMVLLYCHASVIFKFTLSDVLTRTSLLLFLVFFPRGPRLPVNGVETKYTWRMAVMVAFICLLHGLFTVIISVVLLAARPHLLQAWANTLGIVATGLAAVQYFPQIWMTWHLGHVGSLSIPMMMIQTPGSFVWSASLAARLGIDGWSTWGIFLVTGCLQGCLLVMGIMFEYRARKEAREQVSTCLRCESNMLTFGSLGENISTDTIILLRLMMRVERMSRVHQMREHR